MKNPIITVSHENLVMIDQHARQIAMQVITDESSLQKLICSFLENGQHLYAAVIAPMEEIPGLSRRVVSFLGAYMRVVDAALLEQEIQRCITFCAVQNSRH
jgi:hypothetical protein